jgi:hypothetical protein
MDPSLIISCIAIAGFAGALTYNVYEFKKVGRSLNRIEQSLVKIVDRLSEMSKEHKEMMRALKGRKRS